MITLRNIKTFNVIHLPFQIDLADVSIAFEESFKGEKLSRAIAKKIPSGHFQKLLLRILNGPYED